MMSLWLLDCWCLDDIVTFFLVQGWIAAMILDFCCLVWFLNLVLQWRRVEPSLRKVGLRFISPFTRRFVINVIFCSFYKHLLAHRQKTSYHVHTSLAHWFSTSVGSI